MQGVLIDLHGLLFFSLGTGIKTGKGTVLVQKVGDFTTHISVGSWSKEPASPAVTAYSFRACSKAFMDHCVPIALFSRAKT